MTVKPQGIIDVSGLGYLGGLPSIKIIKLIQVNPIMEGDLNLEPNFGGGGGGSQGGNFGSKGGGGYGTAGRNSDLNTYFQFGNKPGGKGDLCYGDDEMNIIYMGSGGGAGATFESADNKGRGGYGGGVIVIIAKEFYNEGRYWLMEKLERMHLKVLMQAEEVGEVEAQFLLMNLLVDNRGEVSVNGGDGGDRGFFFFFLWRKKEEMEE